MQGILYVTPIGVATYRLRITVLRGAFVCFIGKCTRLTFNTYFFKYYDHCVCAKHACVKDRQQLTGVGSLLPPYRS